MKKNITVGSLVLSVLLLLPIIALCGDKENSMLWKVSGNGLSQPSYLFGTVHMICKEDYFLKPKVEKAFQQAETVVMEINMTDTAQMMGMMMLMMSPTPLSQGLTEAEKQMLDKMLQEKIGTPLSMLEYVKPSAVYILLASNLSQEGCDSVMSYELELIKMSKEQNKKMDGLETMAQQMSMLDSVFTVKDLLKEDKEVSMDKAQLAKLINAYKAEDLKLVSEFINHSGMMEAKSEQVLLTNRNKQWAQRIPELMKKGVHFFAVGAGHLPGKDGVLQLLRKSGYTVEPILD